MLAADTRVTFQKKGFRDIHCDTAQKLFALAPGTAISFVGDVTYASTMLRLVIINLKQQARQDPISLKRWLPRILRAAYLRLVARNHRKPSLAFMVASSVEGRPNVIHRTDILRLFDAMAARNRSGGFQPGIFLELLQRKGDQFALGGTPQGLLYTMTAPDFQIADTRPLNAVVLGSGSDSKTQISELRDLVFYWNPFGNQQTAPTGLEALWLRKALESALAVQTVGGLFPATLVRGSTISHLGEESRTPEGELLLSIKFENGRWVQRNHTTRQELALSLPWELVPPSRSVVFDRSVPPRK